MSVEIMLMLLESILLIATLALLIYGIREGKQRNHLIKEVARATRVLKRQEYFLASIDSMLDAEREIVGCITGRPPSGSDLKWTRSFTDAIAKMAAKGVRIRYLLPKFPDRLQIGVQYAAAGAEIFFSSCLMVHNTRYIVVDEKIVVLGIPESIGEKEATKKGYKIPSGGLAEVLRNYFKTCDDQVSLKDYLQEVKKLTGASTEHLVREFRIDEASLRKILQ